MGSSSASETSHQPHPTIVGIGASAGGLGALKTFFQHVPEDSDLAFVIVVHLSPDHESHLADLLQPHVKMPVQQVTGTVALKPNQVYVIPPGCNLNTIDTHLRLSDLEEKRRERAPIDHFFRTLSETHDGDSVGVILTGTGSDGTLGLKEIKEKGGLTVVQDPTEAEYDGMPQSAIATGLIDLVLPLAKIPAAILRFARTEPRVAVPAEDQDLHDEERPLLHKVFTQVRARTGRDFSRYKRSTVIRRLRRRMQLTQTEELSDYLLLLRQDPLEIVALSDDFLITVTNFFRDPAVFAELEQNVIPQLFADKGPEQNVRVWSVGCSTGEEAYSLAMLLLEEAGRREAPPEIQVFASDLHESSLLKAREAYYPGDIKETVSAERLRRFFIKEDGGYRIRKEVRDLVVFAPHNLLGDPPFSRIDLIACRNLLIYLQRTVQHEVIELFHYALRPGGTLLLGTSETIENSELFRTENKKLCLFRKRNVPAPDLHLPVFPLARTRPANPLPPGTNAYEDEPVVYGALHQQIVERYAPPSLLVGPNHRVVHLSEHVGRYLVHPGGEVTTNVFKLVRPEFHLELRSALHAAQEEGPITRSAPVMLSLEGVPRQVLLSVLRAPTAQQEGFFVVTFDEQTGSRPAGGDATPPADAATAGEDPSRHDASRSDAPDTAQQQGALRNVENELIITKQHLQAIAEEYEANREEMKASNEEMQSTNEELRSTLEELETSKEELQSMNEELTTLNQENRHKVEELSQLSGDLQNLLAATHIATLFLDRQTRIMRFTPQVSELFNVRTQDRGRPLSDITHRLGYNELQADAQRVLDQLIPVEREVQDEAQRWYITRVLPYRSADDRIEGVVITFVDITDRKRAEQALRRSEEFHRLAVEAGQIGTWDVDLATNDCYFSPHMVTLMGYSPDRASPDSERQQVVTRARWMKSVYPEDRPALEAALSQASEQGSFEQEFRIQANQRIRWLYSRGNVVRNDTDDAHLYGASIDITERKQSEETLRQNERRLKNILEHIPAGVVIAEPGGALVYGNREVERIFQASFIPSANTDDYQEWPLYQSHTDERYPPDQMPMTRTLASGNIIIGEEMRVQRPDGTFRTVLVNTMPVYDEAGKITLGVAAFIDVTERLESEEALRRSEEKTQEVNDLLALATNASQLGWGTWNFVTNEAEWDERGRQIVGLEEHENSVEDWLSRLHPEDRPRITSYVRERMAQKPSFTMEYRVVKSTGEVCWVHGSGAFEGDADGRPVRGTGLVRDVTEQKQAEDALRQAKETAEQAARAKEDFLAHMSHEIRTPLNAVVGLTHLLLDREPKEEQLENLRTLQFSAANLHTLVNDILDFSKLQAGKVMTEATPTRLRDLLRSLENAHRPQADERDVALHVAVDDSLPSLVSTDSLKLSQVMNNLLSNAVKFTQQGTVTVDVAVDRREDEQLWVTFSVQDTGVGIAPDKLATIFDAFTQADISTVREYGGTGLGLSITKLLLEQMNSHIEVESKVGQGTRFFFTVPMEASASEASVTDGTPPPPAAMPSALRVLLVEDVAVNRMLLIQFLQQWWQFVPDEAVNGQRAVEMAQQRTYDLILMDIRMPVMDGYRAAREIRKLPGYAHVPILALTADTANELEKHVEARLFTDVITKPFSPQELKQQLLRHAIQRPPAAASEAVDQAPPVVPDKQKLTELFDRDPSKMQLLLESARDELTKLQQHFPPAVATRDEAALRDMLHRTKVLFDLLGLSPLEDLLRRVQELLAAQAPEEELQRAQETGETILAQVLTTLREPLNDY